MKKTVTLIIFILTLAVSLKAQQRSSGIKILVKDKETGFPFMNDSMAVIFNDTINNNLSVVTMAMLFLRLFLEEVWHR